MERVITQPGKHHWLIWELLVSLQPEPVSLTELLFSMTMYPIIPDFNKYPETGRELRYTSGEIGLAGHWIKHFLHFAFIYKAKANPLWRIIPE